MGLVRALSGEQERPVQAGGGDQDDARRSSPQSGSQPDTDRARFDPESSRLFDLETCTLASTSLQGQDWSAYELVIGDYLAFPLDPGGPTFPNDEFFTKLYGCLDAHEPLFIITGLPGVSGVYTARDFEVDVGYGYAGLLDNDFDQTSGTASSPSWGSLSVPLRRSRPRTPAGW